MTLTPDQIAWFQQRHHAAVAAHTGRSWLAMTIIDEFEDCDLFEGIAWDDAFQAYVDVLSAEG